MSPRRPRRHDEAHLEFVRGLPCVICGDNISSEAAHIRFAAPDWGKRSVGMQEKPDDNWTVPLCNKHHRDQHSHNERGWWAGHGRDPVKIAMALYIASGDHELGEQIVLAHRWVG